MVSTGDFVITFHLPHFVDPVQVSPFMRQKIIIPMTNIKKKSKDLWFILD